MSDSPSLAQILEVIRPQVEKIEEGFKGVRVTLDALAEHVGAGTPLPAPQPSAEPPAAAPPQPAAEPLQPAPVAELPPVEVVEPEPVPPPPPQPAPEPARAAIQVAPNDGGDWSRLIFGEQVGTDPSVGALSGALLTDLRQGDCDAMGLVGLLLVFNSSTSDRKLKMLKDLGEAYYRWNPTGAESLRDALITWIHALLEQGGIANRIVVAQIGDRYDMQSHNAKERGVEVTDVHGWVVLRDNGKVYSKANVSVR